MIDYELILKSIFPDLTIADEHGRYVFVGEDFERKYGFTASELIGLSIEERKALRLTSFPLTENVLKTGKRIIKTQKNSHGIPIIIEGCPIFDDVGHIRYIASWSFEEEEISELEGERKKLEKVIRSFKKQIDAAKHEADMIDLGAGAPKGAATAQDVINKVKDLDVSVLLTGESGTGKSTYARYIHLTSPRCDKPFIEISCGAIPEQLMESELFGYVHGAFTGARSAGKSGRIEMANGGTLFLDEIGELPLHLQSKLLHVLQTHTFTRIGGNENISVNFRLITATNRDLQQMVREGKFREDLYYRINIMQIEVPPLREQPWCIPVLVNHYLEKFNKKYGWHHAITPEVMDILQNYNWPGNIRELQNAVLRMSITTDDDIITTEQLPPALAGQMISGSIEAKDDKTVKEKTDEFALNDLLHRYEGQLIRRAYNKYGTTVGVAKSLGISQSQASRKIREYCANKDD